MLSDVEQGSNLMLTRLTPVATLIASVRYQAQYNPESDYICKLWVVEVRDVVLLYPILL